MFSSNAKVFGVRFDNDQGLCQLMGTQLLYMTQHN